MIKEKMTYPQLKEAIEYEASKYAPEYILIEDKASGQSVIQDLESSGYSNIVAIKPKFDKITRFASVVSLFQSGSAMIPSNSKFNKDLIYELTHFPNTGHDDIVDSVSQFLNFTKTMPQQNRRVKITVL